MLRIVAVALVLLSSGCSGERAPFWRVEGAGEPSYLLGTMHRGVDAELLPAPVWEAFHASRLVVTEADLRSVDANEFRALIALPAGVSVQQVVSPEDWLLMVDEISGLFNASQLDSLQPWYTHGALISSYLPEGEEMDIALVRHAVEEGIALGFLETWQAQGELLNDLGLESSLVPFLQAVRNPELTRAMLDEWALAYRAGDIEQLETLGFDQHDMQTRPRWYEEVIYERNEAWLPLLREEIDRGGVFAAVGFTHLLGERSVVSLLEEEGYRVEFVW